MSTTTQLIETFESLVQKAEEFTYLHNDVRTTDHGDRLILYIVRPQKVYLPNSNTIKIFHNLNRDQFYVQFDDPKNNIRKYREISKSKFNQLKSHFLKRKEELDTDKIDNFDQIIDNFYR